MLEFHSLTLSHSQINTVPDGVVPPVASLGAFFAPNIRLKWEGCAVLKAGGMSRQEERGRRNTGCQVNLVVQNIFQSHTVSCSHSNVFEAILSNH